MLSIISILQIIEYFENRTTELHQKLPQKPFNNWSSEEVLVFTEAVLAADRTYSKVEALKVYLYILFLD